MQQLSPDQITHTGYTGIQDPETISVLFGDFGTAQGDIKTFTFIDETL